MVELQVDEREERERVRRRGFVLVDDLKGELQRLQNVVGMLSLRLSTEEMTTAQIDETNAAVADLTGIIRRALS